jgi:hypothetical protein
MVEVRQESRRVLDRILNETVLERTDKSSHVHPQQQVTMEYLDAQASDQARFYQSYR